MSGGLSEGRGGEQSAPIAHRARIKAPPRRCNWKAMRATRTDSPPPAAAMKGRSFAARLGFAFAGIRIVWRRERSFRTQALLGGIAMAVTIAIRPGWIWAAAMLLAIGFVLALELANAALEYALDRLHPEIAAEIGFAKDAAAGAVLVASLAAAGVGAAMLLSTIGR
jgi:diacylglycerol kinase (ATP)